MTDGHAGNYRWDFLRSLCLGQLEHIRECYLCPFPLTSLTFVFCDVFFLVARPLPIVMHPNTHIAVSTADRHLVHAIMVITWPAMSVRKCIQIQVYVHICIKTYVEMHTYAYDVCM